MCVCVCVREIGASLYVFVCVCVCVCLQVQYSIVCFCVFSQVTAPSVLKPQDPGSANVKRSLMGEASSADVTIPSHLTPDCKD